MQSNIQAVRTEVESHEQTERVELDGGEQDVIVRAIIDGNIDRLEEHLERAGLDVNIRSVNWTPFGSEVEIR
jgi:hypothetical protein